MAALIAQLQAAPAMAQAVEAHRAIESAVASEQREQTRAAAVQVRIPLLDVRGMRVDETLRVVELELDRATRAGEEGVHVLHGHGSGALKAAVREHLQRSPYVSKARSAEAYEGGDGVTVVELA